MSVSRRRRTQSKQRELRTRLNQIPGVAIPDDRLNKQASIPLSKLAADDALERLATAMTWVYAEMKKAHATTEAS